MSFHRIRILSARDDDNKLMGVFGGYVKIELDGHPVQVDRLELTVDQSEYNVVTMTLRGVEVDVDLDALPKTAEGRRDKTPGGL